MSHGLKSMQTINLVDKINEAFDKINENFELVLDSDDVIQIINNESGLDSAQVRAIITGSDLNMGGNKVLFGNVYSTESDLPNAGTYHGMFAHVHSTGKAYFAHAGQWVEIGGSNVSTEDVTNIVNNILDSDYFLSVINEEYLQQFTINTDVSYLDSDISANASAIFELTSRIDATDSGVLVLSQALIQTQADLDGLVLGGIDSDLLADAIASANTTVISRIEGNSDSISILAGVIDSVEADLILLDSATNNRIDLNTSAISALTSRVTVNENGLTAVVSSVDSLGLTLDQFITDGIEITPEQVTSALGGALDELTLRLDADSDKLVLEAAKIVDLNTQLTALDSDTGAQIQAEADARSELSATVSLIDGRVTSQSNDITTLTASVDSDIASVRNELQAVVDDQGNTTATWNLDLVAGTEDDPKVAGIKFGNDGTRSDFAITTDAFKIFNGTSSVPAFKVEDGDVFLDQVSINTLTVGDLQGDINVITPFSGSGYRTWGPTSAGYKLLTTVDLPANATPGIAHVPTINMAFSGIFKTDTAYIKLSMSKASTGLDNYTQIQVMRQRSTSGGSSWAVIPVVGAWSAPVSEDVRFKIEVQMYGDNGTSNTSASLGGTNYWSGTVAGLVGNVSNSLTTGGSTTTTAEDAGVTGTVVDTDGNTVTLTEDQLNNYDYSNLPNIDVDLTGLF